MSSSERRGKRAEREEKRGKRAERDERRETGGERREKREERSEKREARRVGDSTHGIEASQDHEDKEKREERREEREERREKTEDRATEAARGLEIRPPDGSQPFSTPCRPGSGPLAASCRDRGPKEETREYMPAWGLSPAACVQE